MKFTETILKGAYVITLDPFVDERGFFARSFCRDEFKKHELDFNIAQCNVSYNKKAGTLRGMHYQVSPHEESKLVRCTYGIVWDAMIDLRPESPTFKQWFGAFLNAKSNMMVYVPKGFAHGYLSLTDGAALLYMVSEPYHPECERTVRWDDPAIGIKWPWREEFIISEKDRNASNI